MSADLSWDEFRLVKAIADSRSLTGAAEALGLNHSTVFRRLAALESAVGSHLFERSRSGYEPTAAGDEMIALATVMADSIIEFERRIAGRDFKPAGCLRVTTNELIAHHFLPAIMPQFRAQYPEMVLELILCDQILSLSRRDADVAIRLTNDPLETLVGRRVCACGGACTAGERSWRRSDQSAPSRFLSSAIAKTLGRPPFAAGSRPMFVRAGSRRK